MKNTKLTQGAVALSLGLAALAGTAANASVVIDQPFTLDLSSNGITGVPAVLNQPGSAIIPPNTTSAIPINDVQALAFGNTYNAIINQNTAVSLQNSPFVEVGYVTKSTVLGGTLPTLDAISHTGINATYQLFEVFSLKGTASVDTGTGINTATFTAGTVALYLDTGFGSSLAVTGPTGAAQGDGVTLPTISGISGSAVLLGWSGLDLASATTALNPTGGAVDPASHATVNPGFAHGDYRVDWTNWTLTAAGSALFVAPVPFYTINDLNGNTDTFGFTYGSPTTPFVTTASGGGHESFAVSVPEPASLALFGLGLAALSSSRKKKA